MGLAGTRTKQRFGLDPRNTHWSNDTNRFGHKFLTKLGWKPGKGLGLTEGAVISHVKVSLKADNVGLGAKLHKKRAKCDEFDSGENVHLDAFQRLLGRLNGKEEQIDKEVDRKRQERIINGRWGINFVRGDTLCSTWDKENKQLKKLHGKRTIDEVEEPETIKLKKSKKSKKEKKLEKSSADNQYKEKEEKKHKEKKEKKEKIGRKERKDKNDKKERKDRKEKKNKKEKNDRKIKKHKKDKKNKSDDLNTTRESMLKPKENESAPKVIGSRMALRSKWIRQKRAAVMDEKALQEIFMIK